MNFPSAQRELIMGPNLLPIKLINSNKIVDIYFIYKIKCVLDTTILSISRVLST